MEIPNLALPIVSYLDETGKLAPECRRAPDDALLVKGYKIMLQTRLVEERMITLQRQGLISFALTSFGEEACAVASAAALEMGDWMYPQYRELGILFFRGFTIQEYVHNMFGDAEDLNLGRQLPVHVGSRKLNVVTVSSPIATKLPHAAGCAYAMKLQGEKSVAISYFGEGATSEGDFHAALNFASVRKVPAIFFCRNNGFAISTPCSRQFASDGIAPKGVGYGIPAIRVDGNDFFAVYDAVTEARNYCIEGKGPVLIEAMTYRMGAHSTSDDPSVYRKETDVEERKLKCPLIRLRKYLENRTLWDDKREGEWTSKVTEELSQAIQKAKETPQPPLETLIEHVYFAVPQALKEEMGELPCRR